MSRDPLLLLEDIEKASRRIVRYTEGRARDAVFSDDMRFDAVLHNLHVIGEAVKNLPPNFRERHGDIPWREIAGMRDFVAHPFGYGPQSPDSFRSFRPPLAARIRFLGACS